MPSPPFVSNVRVLCRATIPFARASSSHRHPHPPQSRPPPPLLIPLPVSSLVSSCMSPHVLGPTPLIPSLSGEDRPPCRAAAAHLSPPPLAVYAPPLSLSSGHSKVPLVFLVPPLSLCFPWLPSGAIESSKPPHTREPPSALLSSSPLRRLSCHAATSGGIPEAPKTHFTPWPEMPRRWLPSLPLARAPQFAPLFLSLSYCSS